jgi:hypothetical protein
MSMIRRVLPTLCLVFALVLRAAPCRAADNWIEVRSAHFTVLSSASEGATRTLAWQFEQIRSAIAALWPWARVDTSTPFLIIVVKDENGMKTFAPKYWEQDRNAVRPASVWIRGDDQHYILLRSDVRGVDTDTQNPYRTAYHAYVSTVLQASFDRRLPLWFEDGLSEVMSNTIVRDSYVSLGPVIPSHLQLLNSQARMSLPQLLATTRDSREYLESERRWVLDAQAWAFVHFLMFGEQSTHEKQLARFGGLLQTGTEPAVAFKEAFGPIEAYEKPFLDYVRHGIYAYLKASIDVGVKREGFAVRQVPAAEAAAARAAFHVAMNRPVEAQAAIDEARKADASSAAAEVADGLLLDRMGKRDAARAAFGRAVERGTPSAYAHYRFARLGWVGDQPDAAALAVIEKSATRAAALNPRSAAAYAFLAEVRAAMNEPPDVVTGLVRRAISLEPGEARHHLAAARVFWRVKMDQEAQQAAEKAKSLANDDYERAEADRLLKFFETAKKPGGDSRD